MIMSSSEPARRKVVILGAGIGGLSAGWALARKGFKVTIMEKTLESGGLARTRKTDDGFEYDIGPHNIHTRHAYILAFLKKTFSSLYRHELTSKIHKRGRFITYPLKGAAVILSLPVWRIPLAVGSFLAARARMFLGEPREDGSFEDWIRNRFGAVLFREYFCDYPTKVWRIPPREIDKHVGEKRIPIYGFVELLRSAILGRIARVDHPEVAEDNFYMKHGIGEICGYFESGFEKAGGVIRFGEEIRGVEIRNASAVAVETASSTGKRREECDYLLSTIPLNEFIPLLLDAPDGARRAASQLDYCSSVLLFLKIARRDVLPSTMLYFSEPDVMFSRVTDGGVFSRDMVPEGKTLLCVEFPCTVSDPLWSRSEEELRAHAEKVLIGTGVLRAGDIEGQFVERVSHSYPRFRVGFEQRVRTCLGALEQFRNVVSFGRQGAFAYVNTDTVTHWGFVAAASVDMAEAMDQTCQEWFLAHMS
ncbi:MAG: FAD-dependent oxidoreductase [Candidatus Hydrogenedentota bacterium]